MKLSCGPICLVSTIRMLDQFPQLIRLLGLDITFRIHFGEFYTICRTISNLAYDDGSKWLMVKGLRHETIRKLAVKTRIGVRPCRAVGQDH